MLLYIKLIVWIVLFGVLGACRIQYPLGVTPDMLFCFSICFAALNRKFRDVFATVIVCAVVSAALSGVPILYSIVLFGLSGVIIYELECVKQKRNILFIMLYVAFFSLIGQLVLYNLIGYMWTDFEGGWNTVIAPTTISNMLASVIVYIVAYTNFGEKRKRAIHIKVV